MVGDGFFGARARAVFIAHAYTVARRIGIADSISRSGVGHARHRVGRDDVGDEASIRFFILRRTRWVHARDA
jgi:hypothetical protein